MFTGIVEEVGVVLRISFSPVFQLDIGARKVVEGLKVSDSICVNGVCLTVTERGNNNFKVQVMPHTLNKTNLGSLRPQDKINLERALTPASFMGGHFVTGDIDGLAMLKRIKKEASQWVLTLKPPSNLEKYIVSQGRVALQGVSLTVADKRDGDFQVCLIPYTLEYTTLKYCKEGDFLNIEVDILAKYVNQILTSNNKKGNELTFDFLRQAGY